MKLLMIMTPTDCLDDLQALVRRHDVHAFTELPDLPGEGRTGMHLGTRAFPGTSSIFLTVVDDPIAARIAESVREYAARPETCDQVRVFALDAVPLV